MVRRLAALCRAGVGVQLAPANAGRRGRGRRSECIGRKGGAGGLGLAGCPPSRADIVGCATAVVRLSPAQLAVGGKFIKR